MSLLFSIAQSAFDWTWKTSAWAAVLAILVFIAQNILGKSAAPRFRYALSLLVLVRLLLPVAPASSFSVGNLLPRKTATPIITGAPFLTENVPASKGSGIAPAPSVPRVANHTANLSLPNLFCLIWLVGFLGLSGLAAWRYLKWRRWIKMGENITEPRLLALIESCRLAMGVTQRVRAVAVPQAETPAVFGFRHVCLLLPRVIIDRLNESELRLIVLHEMAHVRRKDSRFNILLMAAQYAHWFNPLVWLAFHRTRADAELICDEMAMRLAKPEDRSSYGQLLLKLLSEFPAGNRFIPSTVAVVGSKREIKRRIIMIKNHGRKRMAGCVLAIAIAVLLAFVTFTRAESSSAPSISTADQANDAWFVMDRNHLLRVPPGQVVFRPTHFHDNFERAIIYAPYENKGRKADWIMGRDLPLRIAVAVAYKVNRATVVLPADAPTTHFDFLVTTFDDPTARLATAIHQKLGLVAQKETRQTAVLAIRVIDPKLRNLTVSTPNEKPGVNYKKGDLHFSHVQIGDLAGPFEREIDTPLVDETGLTNYYDFSMPWNYATERRFLFEATSRAAIDQMLGKIGLTLQEDNAPVDMLVVQHL